MFSKFFIDRPVLAGVIAIVIVIAGLVASAILPIAQYPDIAPPTVIVNTSYPGASAETIAKTVAAPIEERALRRRASALLQLQLLLHRRPDDHRDVRRRHEHRHRGVQRQQPRAARTAATARRRASQRRDGAEALERHPAAGRARFAGQQPRHAVPVELRNDHAARRAQARARRRRRQRLRRARLLDAHLAASRSAGAARTDRQRHRRRLALAEQRSTPPARSAQSRRSRARAWSTRSLRAVAWSSRKSSARS